MQQRYLIDYFNSAEASRLGIPSVRSCAEIMNLSASYFGNLLKSETCKSAGEHIQYLLLE